MISGIGTHGHVRHFLDKQPSFPFNDPATNQAYLVEKFIMDTPGLREGWTEGATLRTGELQMQYAMAKGLVEGDRTEAEMQELAREPSSKVKHAAYEYNLADIVRLMRENDDVAKVILQEFGGAGLSRAKRETTAGRLQLRGIQGVSQKEVKLGPISAEFKKSDIPLKHNATIKEILAMCVLDSDPKLLSTLKSLAGSRVAEFEELQLMIAIQYNRAEMVAQLLNKKVNPNLENDKGETLLCMAIQNSYKDPVIVEKLIAAGARVNDKNKEGQSPLMIAAKLGNEAIVSLLLAREANVNDVNKNGNTALMEASSGWAQASHGTIVAKLLKQGARIDETNQDGDTALILAAKRGNRFVVDKLLVNDANKDMKNKADKNAMELTQDPLIRQLLMKSKVTSSKPTTSKLIYSKLPKLPDKPSGPPVSSSTTSTDSKPVEKKKLGRD